MYAGVRCNIYVRLKPHGCFSATLPYASLVIWWRGAHTRLYTRAARGLNGLQPGLTGARTRSRHGAQPGPISIVSCTSSFDKQTPVCSAPVITPHTAAEASYPLAYIGNVKTPPRGLYGLTAAYTQKDRRAFPAVFCIKRVSALRFPDCAGG